MAFFLAAASLVSMEGSFGLMLSNAIFLIMMLNYNYTVKDLPWAKNIHVALTAVIPAPGFPIWLGIAQEKPRAAAGSHTVFDWQRDADGYS